MSRKGAFPIRNRSLKPKHQKSLINGQTEVSLHNQLLRADAKARQY
ncbi:YpzG family protein [Ureibacillus sp. FSL K6-8385]|nr:YpzG family protein [Ureibacillus terrenus]MED3765144.1 YpzG family protein [Ureibacillus terrenus]